jgi:deoxyribodipyrimidine photolyase
MRRALRISDNGPLRRALEEGADVIPFLCTHELGDGAGRSTHT